jgi:hypothetical protein
MWMMWKRQRRAWWAVGVFAGLAMLCFLTFDVLDLDGSNLTRGRPGEALTLDAVGPDVERMLALVPNSLIPSGVQRTAVVYVSHSAPHPSHDSPAFSRLRLRFATALPRGRTEHTPTRASSTGPAEPA